MKQKIILVTGGSGFIGHHLIRYLINKGHAVFNVDISSTNPNEKINVLDLEALTNVFKLLKPDVVIHLAAVASVPECEKCIEDCFDTNVKGVLNVAMLCSKFGCKLIFASSAAVYGKPLKLPTPVTHPTNPINIYGLTKSIGEQIVRYYTPSSHIIFRIFNVYGPECYRSYVIPDVIKKILAGYDPVPLRGTGEESRDFIFIEDVLDAFWIAIETNISGTFNLGSGTTYKIKDIAEMIKNIMGKHSLRFVFEKIPREGEFHISMADISEGNRIPHWIPRVEIRQGLERVIRWYINGK